MKGKFDKRLTILSEAERTALYNIPNFDDFERAEYFALTKIELALVHQRKGLAEQIYCLLQIGYFKAKQNFFRLSPENIPSEDIAFVMQRYFPGKIIPPQPLNNKEYYAQRLAIAKLFGYRFWSETNKSPLIKKAVQLTRRDCSTIFILTELIGFLNAEKIVRPGYTTLQTIISNALTEERCRLSNLIEGALDSNAREELNKLITQENTLSKLAALKQDAKNFNYKMMVLEREKRTILEPLYHLAKRLLPKLDISQQNILYYASLAHYYTIYDLRRLQSNQTYLYLLCYAWQRYRQFNDNLVDALNHHMRKIEESTKEISEKKFLQSQASKQKESFLVGRLLLLYADDDILDITAFGVVRKQAFAIMPKETVLLTGKRLCEKPISQHELRWQAVDQTAVRFKKQLRPLYMALEFSGVATNNPWLAALTWMRSIFSKQKTLSSRALHECPENTVPKRLRPYLLTFNNQGEAIGIQGDRYEFWIYRQIRKRVEAGELYLNDSLQHRSLADELVAMDQKAEAIQALNIPWLHQPTKTTLDVLSFELHQLWQTFDRDLRQEKLKHLEYNTEKKTLTWHKPKVEKEQAQSGLYINLPTCSIADVFHFVNEQCHFLEALTPLQPRYAKKLIDTESVMATIFAQAMNHGNFRMAEISDIPYHILEATYRQYLRLSTLKAANDRISNFIAGLSIFPHYSIDLDILYGSVDGQKFEAENPTVKARYSSKYFGRSKGVVAHTLLSNHIALQSNMISPHEHESHFAFDIYYNNTSDIIPDVVTGDMHSINKANFGIFFCFGACLYSRFTNLQAQLKHLYCSHDLPEYEKFLIQPVGKIDFELILSEKANIDQIIATLALKEMTQSTLIKKLCTYNKHNKTRRALFELDKLIRSIYTLRYFMDTQLQSNVHRSQNRIEAYHQLRSAIAQVGGKKELCGKTDLDMAISNQCGRLIANLVIAYNSILLSTLLDRYELSADQKALDLLKKISPVAWQHIHFLGNYVFRGNKHTIDLEKILSGVSLT